MLNVKQDTERTTDPFPLQKVHSLHLSYSYLVISGEEVQKASLAERDWLDIHQLLLARR
jgi:hypothetical protein